MFLRKVSPQPIKSHSQNIFAKKILRIKIKFNQIENVLNLRRNNLKVKSITIHQAAYIKEERVQNTMQALIETSQHFDFTSKEKVGPICLPGYITLLTITKP